MNKKIVGSKEFKSFLENISDKFVQDCRTDFKKMNAGIVGIHNRGVHLAKRIQKYIEKKYKHTALTGSLDITLYRDDVGEIGSQPLVKETHIPFSIDGKTILLVDDVLFTGRTIRAALDALLEMGRPKAVRLAVAVDRGGRELPIQADYFGTRMTVGKSQEVQLKVMESDGDDSIWIVERRLSKKEK